MDGLIGHTGFVGSNLARAHLFERRYNSQNIESIAGEEFELLVCSGMPAEKWRANENPAADSATLERLTSCLATCSAKRLVLVSTVDVYPSPIGVDESTAIDESAQQPYGRNRFRLERFVSGRFEEYAIIRLPGLFGPGLKKNAIFDFLNDNQTERIHSQAIFQWYPVARLWQDICTVLDARAPVVNFATEPLSVAEMTRQAFGFDFDHPLDTTPARYDMQTEHASLFAKCGRYMMSKTAVARSLSEYVRQERERAP